MESRRTISLARSGPAARYGGALGLFLVALAVRLLIDPLILANYGLTCFYPAVILAAYWMGARPAALTAVLSTGAVLVFQAQERGSLALDGPGWVKIVFFVITSALAIYLLTTIRHSLRDLSDRLDQTRIQVVSQAELLKDHSERVTNHMQLIAAILALRADREEEEAMSRVLANAASRTLLISRMHREFAGTADSTVDFPAFARRLAEVAAPLRPVAVRGDRLDLPLEHATALGLVLLDQLGASGGPAHVEVRADGERIHFSFAADHDAAPQVRPASTLLDAISAQLRTPLHAERQGGRTILRFSFRKDLQPPPPWAPLEHAVH